MLYSIVSLYLIEHTTHFQENTLKHQNSKTPNARIMSYEDVKGVELRLEGMDTFERCSECNDAIDMNETNTYALAMSSSMERVREFMRKSKRCGILDIITILKNGTRIARGGILLGTNTSLLIRDVRSRSHKRRRRRREKER